LTSALLIIDVQQGLCEGEGQAFASAPLMDRINTVAQKMRQAGLPVVFIQHESGPGYPVRLLEDGHTSAGNAVLTAPQVIAHHNATLTHISSFGPRVRTLRCADFQP
jgi:hypothetical protein